MEDEICPYATFHLLGFREEMDPTKALAFPHHHPAHAGTLAHPHPHHPAHSRAGSQSMVRIYGLPLVTSLCPGLCLCGTYPVIK